MGGVGDGARMNALAMLISIGARVTSVNSSSTEMAAAAERRQQARNVNAYLQRAHGIDTGKDRAGSKPKTSREGFRLKGADEVARETAGAPHAVHGPLVRAVRNTRTAKAGRDILREWHERRRAQPGYVSDHEDSDEEAREERAREKKERAEARAKKGGNITAADLAGLAALLDEDDSEDGDNGDNQREDDDEGEGDLAA